MRPHPEVGVCRAVVAEQVQARSVGRHAREHRSRGRDGLEMFLASDRPGTFGMLDLWVSSRASTADQWSDPLNLGSVVNSSFIDAGPAISFDGRALYFQSAHRSDAVGGQGVFDIYVTTRPRLKEPDGD